MTYSTTRLICLCLVSTLCIAGCGDTEDDQNGDDGSQYQIPTPMSDLVTDQDFESLIDEGFDLNEGESPPNIEGTYSADNSTFTYDSSDENTGFPVFDYHWSFFDQSDGAMDVAYESQESDDAATGLGGFIAGQDNCFTVAAQVEGIDGEGCHFERVHLVSGCKVDAGIEDFKTGYVIKTPGGGPDADEETCPPADKVYRIAVETDDLATEVTE